MAQMIRRIVRPSRRLALDPSIFRSELDDYTKPFMWTRPPAEPGYEAQSYYGQFKPELLKAHFVKDYKRWSTPRQFSMDPFPFRRPGNDRGLARPFRKASFVNLDYKPELSPYAPIPTGSANFFSRDVNRLWKYLGPFTTAHVSRDKMSNISLLRGERYRFYINYRYDRFGRVRGAYPGVIRPRFRRRFYYSKLLHTRLFVMTATSSARAIMNSGGIDNYILNTPDSEELSMIHPYYRMWMRGAMKMYDKALSGLAVSQKMIDRLWSERRAMLDAHYAKHLPTKAVQWSDPPEWSETSARLYRDPSRFHEVSDPRMIRNMWRVTPSDVWREQPWMWARAHGRLCPLPRKDDSQQRQSVQHHRSFKDHSPSGFPGLVAM